MAKLPVFRDPRPGPPIRALFYPDDGPEFYELIRELIELKYFVRR
jgi:hypothetical protein